MKQGISMLKRLVSLGCALGLGAIGSGCSIISPVPLWELAKGVGTAASMAVPYGTTSATNTVYHLHPASSSVCIEYNPRTPVADVVPALQLELKRHQIDSRVYEAGPLTAGTLAEQCPVWLKYEAYVAYDTPPMGTGYKPYVNMAMLTLRDKDDRVLASSQYAFEEGAFNMGKWASTQAKLSPVVTALVTGMQ